MRQIYLRFAAMVLVVSLLLAGFAVLLGDVLPGRDVIAYKVPLTDAEESGTGVIRLVDVQRGLPVDFAPHVMADWALAWSSDGRYIAYTMHVPGHGDRIAILDTYDGTQRIVVEGRAAYDTFPTWSPDGAYLAFASSRDPGGVYIANADGSAARSLTPGYENVLFPTWSPDGRQIAFIAYVQRGTGSDFDRVALLVDVVTGEIQRVMSGHTHTPPIWSPDATHLILFSTQGKIQVVDMTTNKQILALESNEIFYRQPAWSPDGSHLVFVNNQEWVGDVYSVDLGNGAYKRLTDRTSNEHHPAWSPDGTHIAVVSNRDSGRSDRFHLYVMSANGQDMQRVSLTPVNILAKPVWRPD